MREMMNLTEERKIPARSPAVLQYGDHTETVPTHPDDFKAHLAWIPAKRFSDMVLKESPSEELHFTGLWITVSRFLHEIVYIVASSKYILTRNAMIINYNVFTTSWKDQPKAVYHL